MTAETTVVQITLDHSLGSAGAPGSLPGTTSPASTWERIPQGSTANSTTHQMMKKIATEVETDMSRLLEFDQRAAEILRMEEQHRLAVGAGLGLAVAEHAGAALFKGITRDADVVDLVAQVMDAAVRIALEEFRDRRALPVRLEQLDFRVGQGDEYRRHAVLG